MRSPAFIKRLFAPAAKTGSKPDRHTRRTVALCHALVSERGEASGDALAREALAAYRMLAGPALTAFSMSWPKNFRRTRKRLGRPPTLTGRMPRRPT
jgi:hypothetical protein